MSIGIPTPNVRSLLIILAAFVGNAQLFGVDLALYVLLPTAFVFQLRHRWTLLPGSMMALLFIAATLLLAATRAPFVGIPYIDAYHLWPLKTLILTGLIAFGRSPTWPISNMVGLFLMALSIFALGQVQDGRLYSVFGPNMLYRLFGLLLLFSAVYAFKERLAARLLVVLVASLGLLGILLTGSAGGLPILIVAGFVFLYRWSKMTFLAMMAGLAALLVVVWGHPGSLDFLANSDLVSVSRTIRKLGMIGLDTRVIGVQTIFLAPPNLLGHDYTYFSDLWFTGYQYPHNIFAELYGFFGAIGIALSVVVLIAIPHSIAPILFGDVFAMTFAVLLLGSMASGDLSDNYGVIGLAAGLVVRAMQRSLSEESSVLEES
jgi:hypothetical protein